MVQQSTIKVARPEIAPQNVFERGAARLGNVHKSVGRHAVPQGWITESWFKPIANIGQRQPCPRQPEFRACQRTCQGIRPIRTLREDR